MGELGELFQDLLVEFEFWYKVYKSFTQFTQFTHGLYWPDKL